MPLDCRSYMVADDDWKYIHAPAFHLCCSIWSMTPKNSSIWG